MRGGKSDSSVSGSRGKARETEAGRPLYATLEYARAFGFKVIEIEEWRTAVLVRDIPSSSWKDALGCYPLAAIDREADLEAGLNRLREAGLVSVALVPDPVMGPSAKELEAFSVCRPFKTHYLIDRNIEAARVPQTHRRWMRKASRLCEITRVKLRENLPEWLKLYNLIVARHNVQDIQRFSPSYFRALAQMSGVDAFAAKVDGRIVAMALWVRSPEVTYYHLGASDDEGYLTHAMYGVFSAAIERYQDCRFIHLGGAAGVAQTGSGLANFKRGFANREVTAYFCGASLNPERYAVLAESRSSSFFFPAYRQT